MDKLKTHKEIQIFRIALSLILLAGWPAILLAQDVQLNATVSSTTVALNENFEYRVEVSGKKTDLPTPKLPEFEGLAVLSGPNQSTNIQFVNGNLSATKTLSYILRPTQTGTVKIPPATLTVGDQTFSSNEITLTVNQASAQTPAQNQGQRNTSDPEISGENLFIRAIPSKTSAYQNEPIIVTYKLYFRVSVRQYELKVPGNTGFWTEEFKLPAQPVIENEQINNVMYQTAILRKVALFATRSGELEIEPVGVTLDAVLKRQARSRSIFDSFFDDPFGRTVRQTISSKPIKVTIKPLPEQGKPTDFSGAVGRYSLNVTNDKSQIKANEATSVKVTLSGEGNIKLLKPPVLNLSPKMEVYDPKETTEIKTDNNKISGSKVSEYIIVPRSSGQYTIPSITFSYFDPRTKKYERLMSKPIDLDILPGDQTAGSSMAAGNLSRQEVELLGEDIRFIKEEAEFIHTDTVIYKRWYYLVLYALGLSGLGVATVYARQNERIRSDVSLARRRKASKQANKHLALAKKYQKPETAKEFYRELSMALQGFICDKLNLQMADFNAQLAQEKMARAKVKENLISDYITCLQENDFRQFAGSDSGAEQMDRSFNEVKKIISQLEKSL